MVLICKRVYDFILYIYNMQIAHIDLQNSISKINLKKKLCFAWRGTIGQIQTKYNSIGQID